MAMEPVVVTVVAMEPVVVTEVAMEPVVGTEVAIEPVVDSMEVHTVAVMANTVVHEDTGRGIAQAAGMVEALAAVMVTMAAVAAAAARDGTIHMAEAKLGLLS